MTQAPRQLMSSLSERLEDFGISPKWDHESVLFITLCTYGLHYLTAAMLASHVNPKANRAKRQWYITEAARLISIYRLCPEMLDAPHEYTQTP